MRRRNLRRQREKRRKENVIMIKVVKETSVGMAKGVRKWLTNQAVLGGLWR